MMEESPEEAAKREDMLKMYHACKESLRIIGNSDLLLNLNQPNKTLFNLCRRRFNGHGYNASSAAG